MTRQEKIRFLSRYIEIDEDINRLYSELSMWRERATKITPTYSDMPKGGEQEDKIQSAVEKIISLEREIDSEIDVLVKARDEIVMAVLTVDNKILRRLLALRYLNRSKNNTWNQIAEKLTYTWRHVMRLHNLALDSMQVK